MVVCAETEPVRAWYDGWDGLAEVAAVGKGEEGRHIARALHVHCVTVVWRRCVPDMLRTKPVLHRAAAVPRRLSWRCFDADRKLWDEMRWQDTTALSNPCDARRLVSTTAHPHRHRHCRSDLQRMCSVLLRYCRHQRQICVQRRPANPTWVTTPAAQPTTTRTPPPQPCPQG